MRNFIPRTIVLLLAVVFTVAGCKSDKEQKPWKRTGNEVIVKIDSDPEGLNPLLTSTTYASQVNNQLFSYLMFIDPVTLNLIPQLVVGPPQVEEIKDGPYAGGVAYSFEILKEAVWDDGQPVTAADFIFTIKATMNPLVNAQRYRPYLAFIKDVQVDPQNPKKFTVLTNEKYILGEEAVTSTLPVLCAHLYDPDGLLSGIDLKEFTDEAKVEALAKSEPKLQQFADQVQADGFMRDKAKISGSGPYRLESWEPNQRIVLVKKSNWWGDALADRYPALGAYPDRIVFVPINNAATALAALKAEEIDVVSDIDPKDFTDIKVDTIIQQAYNLLTPPSLSSFFIYVNTRNPKLSDKRVRQALAYAINPEEIINTLYYGLARRTTGPMLPGSQYEDPNLKLIPYDPAKAKALLAEAGWTDTNNDGTVDKEIGGKREELKVTYLVSAGREISRNIALLLQSNARKAGIDIELEMREFTQIVADLKKRDYELSSGGRTIPPLLWDPKQSWHSEGDNRTGFGNAQTDALIDELRVTLDKDKRNGMYRQLLDSIYDEQPEIYLYVPSGRIAAHKRFEVQPTAVHPGFFPNLFKLKED